MPGLLQHMVGNRDKCQERKAVSLIVIIIMTITNTDFLLKVQDASSEKTSENCAFIVTL